MVKISAHFQIMYFQYFLIHLGCLIRYLQVIETLHLLLTQVKLMSEKKSLRLLRSGLRLIDILSCRSLYLNLLRILFFISFRYSTYRFLH